MLCSHERESPGVNILQLGDRLKNQNECEGHTTRSQAHEPDDSPRDRNRICQFPKDWAQGKKKERKKRMEGGKGRKGEDRRGEREGRGGRKEGGREYLDILDN